MVVELSEEIYDENGFKVESNEPQISKRTGKRRAGRPNSLTKWDFNRICKHILEGNYVKTAVKASGVNYNTFLKYMSKGKKGIRPYNEYYEQVEQAKAEFEAKAVSTISESGANGNVGAYMWMLPRMYPKRWQSTQRVEAQVDNSQKIEIVRYSDKNKEE